MTVHIAGIIEQTKTRHETKWASTKTFILEDIKESTRPTEFAIQNMNIGGPEVAHDVHSVLMGLRTKVF